MRLSSGPCAAAGSNLWPLLSGVVASLLARLRFASKAPANPYVTHGPVIDPRMFVGREGLIEQVLQSIHSNSLLLRGEEGVGKTSVLYHLKHRLELVEDPHFCFSPVYVDLAGVAEQRLFEILAAAVSEQLALPLAGLHATLDVGRCTGYGARELVCDLRRVISRLTGVGSGRPRLVLLIDQVDVLNRYHPRVNQQLRSMFMSGLSDSLVAVVAGVAIDRRWTREGSPWFNFFEEIEIGPLEADAARRLISEPLGAMVRLERGLAERIVEVSRCRPQQLQRLCSALLIRAHLRGTRRLSSADLDSVVQQP